MFSDVPGIRLTLPRQRSTPQTIEKHKFIPGIEIKFFNMMETSLLATATKRAKRKRLPTIEHLIPVPKVKYLMIKTILQILFLIPG